MSGNRYALLIANSSYEHADLGGLAAPLHDVSRLGDLLTRPSVGGYRVEFVVNETKAAVEQAIERVLVNGERQDTILIFFAGHGLKHQTGKLYFAMSKTDPQLLGSTAVSATWLVDQMRDSRVGSQIVILDCCYGGAFDRGNIGRSSGDTVDSGKMLEIPDLEHSGRGQVVIASADATQFALEDGKVKGEPPASYFVRGLIEGLESGEADQKPWDGRITISELMSYLPPKLRKLGSPQSPKLWIFGLVGSDLLFALNPRWPVVADPSEVSNQSTSSSRSTGDIAGNQAPFDLDGYAEAKRFIAAQEYQKGLLSLRRAAKLRNPDAMMDLAILFEEGGIVDQDYVEARNWYQEVARVGRAEAMKALGDLYVYARGVTEDLAQGRHWYLKAVEAGYSDALISLAELHLKGGPGFPQDYAKARDWYQKAVEAGNNSVIERLAELYLKGGSGLPQDYAKARDWYQKAVEAGNNSVVERLVELDLNGGPGLLEDYAKARDWYQKALEAGNNSVIERLAELYVKGGPGLLQDYAKAQDWYQKALEAGNNSVIERLAELYVKGGPGLPQDYAKAQDWYQKTLEAGNNSVIERLAELYVKGGPGLPQDYAKARDWYHRAAALENVAAYRGFALHAMRRLGELYDFGGPGLAEDRALARDWYLRAAAAGDEEARKAILINELRGLWAEDKSAAPRREQRFRFRRG